MKLIIVSLSLLFAYVSKAQEHTLIQIVPHFLAEKLALNKTFIVKNDTVIINSLKFYITDLRYYKNDSFVYVSTKNAHLIDLTDSNSLKIKESKAISFNIIKFNIGIDSITSVSGAFEGDLDPVQGMYWTWQSGYINFKLEGITNSCPSRFNKFYWHIGGYRYPFNALREVELKFVDKSPIEIFIQIDELFAEPDIWRTCQVMSPNNNAMFLANKLPGIFKTTQP